MEGNNGCDYVCPKCKSPLERVSPQAGAAGLLCDYCGCVYPLAGDIADFLTPTMDQFNNPLIRRVDQADRGYLKRISGLYEGRLWYPLVIRLYLGRNTTSLADLIQRVTAAMNIERGRVLDAACGSATFGRRVASAKREVFGIDISMAMLQKGSEYLRREGVTNMHLARTPVERLPFAERFFDFAICSGSLHLFPDATAALREIGRTLKPGARVAGMTFFNGPGGLVRYAWFRERLRQRGTVHLFELPELEADLEAAGFANPRLQKMGSGVFFTAEKR